MKGLLVLVVVGVGVALAGRRAKADDWDKRKNRDLLLATTLSPDFHDYAQMEVAAQWLDANGYGADALRVRQSIRDKGGHVIVR